MKSQEEITSHQTNKNNPLQKRMSIEETVRRLSKAEGYRQIVRAKNFDVAVEEAWSW